MNEHKLRLQVLCVSMQQKDFSLVEQMNISSDVLIANQSDFVGDELKEYSFGTARLVSTKTRGVGRNRNVAFLYAAGDILLLSDDDMRFYNTYNEDVLREFELHPDADLIIFNIDSNDETRSQKKNRKTKKIHVFSRLPYGAPRIAIRKSSWEKSNVWFTTLFGGGSKYTNGEDSLFLLQMRRAGLKMYVSSKCIGIVDMSESSWFNGANEEFYFNKGVFSKCSNSLFWPIRLIYFTLRFRTNLSLRERALWFVRGVSAYNSGKSYSDYSSRVECNDFRF